MKNATCPICDYENVNPGAAVSCCPRCSTDFTASSPEKKIRGASGMYEVGRGSTNATVYLTDQRLLAVPEKLEGYGLSMVLTAAIVNKMRKKYSVISIALEQIKAVRLVKVGLVGNAIVVDTAEGEALRLRISKSKEWTEAIIAAAPNLR